MHNLETSNICFSSFVLNNHLIAAFSNITFFRRFFCYLFSLNFFTFLPYSPTERNPHFSKNTIDKFCDSSVNVQILCYAQKHYWINDDTEKLMPNQMLYRIFQQPAASTIGLFSTRIFLALCVLSASCKFLLFCLILSVINVNTLC